MPSLKSPRSITSSAPEARSSSKLSVALLPYICPVSGSEASSSGRYAICALEGLPETVHIFSGAKAERNIVATAPDGATLSMVAGISTTRPELSVKETVSFFTSSCTACAKRDVKTKVMIKAMDINLFM